MNQPYADALALLKVRDRRIRELEKVRDKRIRALKSALRHVRASAQSRDVGVVISYAAFERVRDVLTQSAATVKP
ncbi:MAG TPA: hypothetical protein VGL34_25220 [Steroidobacteraceae bacterium]|jgi:hypothetical protein